jgi:bis(5'-nucleosyl)-tetraphosphatase (symmetrical)
MTVYAIGDVQGCYESLRRLLDRIEFDDARDQVWFVGDLVNRGPASLATLRFVSSLGSRAVTVLGNHDLHLLAAAAGHRAPKSSDTFVDVLAAPDRDALVDWLRRRPLFHIDEQVGFAMAHAGVPHIWDFDFARQRAAEIEQVLASEAYAEVLSAMYGNNPACWDDELEGMARVRSIINYFTRMRLIDAVGKLELTYDGPLDGIPKGYKAWFQFYRKSGPALPLIFGHWAAINGKSGVDDLIALDTGCVWGNTLTALRLHDRERFSVRSVE